MVQRLAIISLFLTLQLSFDSKLLLLLGSYWYWQRIETEDSDPFFYYILVHIQGTLSKNSLI